MTRRSTISAPLKSLGSSWFAALTALVAIPIAGCASDPWRLELSNFHAAAGITETYVLTPTELRVAQHNDLGRPRRLLFHRALTPQEADHVLEALGLFAQARAEKSYTCRGIEDGQVLRITYRLGTHRRTTTLQNVYLEPVGTLLKELIPLLPEEPRLTYFLVNRPVPKPDDPPSAPLPPCYIGSAPHEPQPDDTATRREDRPLTPPR